MGCTVAGRSKPGAASTARTAEAPVAFPTLTPFFIPGETLTWQVTLAGISGARARLAVSKPEKGSDGRHTIVLRAEAESSGIAVIIKEVRSSIASWIDADNGVPVRTDSDSFGLGNSLNVNAARRLDDNGEPVADFTILHTKEGEAPTSRTQRLPVVEVHDPLSATLALRAWKPATGTRATMYSLGGTRLWRNVLTFEATEELKTEIGKRRAMRISAVSIRLTRTFEEDNSKPPRTWTLWISDDDQRIPLKITAHTELGDVTAKVTSYQAPES